MTLELEGFEDELSEGEFDNQFDNQFDGDDEPDDEAESFLSLLEADTVEPDEERDPGDGGRSREVTVKRGAPPHITRPNTLPTYQHTRNLTASAQLLQCTGALIP